MAEEARTIRIRCETWDQVEAFYTEKVKGNTLVVKMPQKPTMGAAITVALGLPSGVVFAIDGQVVKTGAAPEGGKVAVAVRLLGLTAQVRDQLERLVAEAKAGLAGLRKPRAQTAPPVVPPPPAPVAAPPPPAPSPAAPAAAPTASELAADAEPRVEDVAVEERPVFEMLDGMRRKMVDQAAHEILGVAAEAKRDEVRKSWLAMAKKLHPDVYGKHRSPGIRRLASEVFLAVSRAYDRLRGTDSHAPATAVRGPWLVEVDEGASVPVPVRDETSSPYDAVEVIRAPAPPQPEEFTDEVSFTTSVRMKALSAEDLFGDAGRPTPPPVSPPGAPFAPAVAPPPVTNTQVAAARVALDGGQFREASELFAHALRADPRNRQLRALYHVAYGLDLKGRGEGVKARLQFETALAHDRECEEAKRALGQAVDKKSLFKKLFER
jgi:tetratricopeptide (TPR) repeat protein